MTQSRVVDAPGTPVPNSPMQLTSSNFGSPDGSGSDLDGVGTRSGSNTEGKLDALLSGGGVGEGGGRGEGGSRRESGVEKGCGREGGGWGKVERSGVGCGVGGERRRGGGGEEGRGVEWERRWEEWGGGGGGGVGVCGRVCGREGGEGEGRGWGVRRRGVGRGRGGRVCSAKSVNFVCDDMSTMS